MAQNRQAQEPWPEFQTVAEVATILRVSKMTVYRLLHNGELESTRVGRSFRVLSDSLRQYITTNPGSDPLLAPPPADDYSAVASRILQDPHRR